MLARLMRRRDVLILLGSAAALTSSASAQPTSSLPLIGFLSSGSPRSFAPLVKAYESGLREQGFVDGQNVTITYRWAEGAYNDLEMMAAELVARGVKVIVASGGVISAKAAMKATKSIPILFVSGSDPVQLGLVASLSRPGGNATGASVFTSELLPKRLELAHDLGPSIKRMAVLLNPSAPTAIADEKDSVDAAQLRGYSLAPMKANKESEITEAFETAAKQQIDVLVVMGDPFFTSRRLQIVELAARFALPVLYPWREYVEAGGLMSYGTELTWGYHLIGRYSGRILRGEKADSLPVQQPTKYSLVINLKAARELRLDFATVAPKLISLADEVIDK
jgi:putative tryptophan/tyrosine transport system substrate-binding protein